MDELERYVLQLKTGDVKQRRDAVRALVDDEVGVTFVQSAAKDDPAPEVRRDAVGWLAVRRRDTPELLDLYHELLSDPAPRVRSMALYAFQQTRVRDPRVLEGIAHGLADDDPFVRQKAVDSLRLTGHNEALPLLLRALQNARPGETDRLLSAIRGYVVEGGELPDDPAPFVDLAANARDRLATPDSSLWMVSDILCRLTRLDVLPGILHIINYDPTLNLNDPTSTSVHALQDLRTLGTHVPPADLINALAPHLKDTEPRKRIGAICAIAVLGGDAAYVKLRPAAYSETHPEVLAVLNAMIAAVAPPDPLADKDDTARQRPALGEHAALSKHTRPAKPRWDATIPLPDVPYTLQLVSIVCDQQQEADGDETYIVFEDNVVWSVERLKRVMADNSRRPEEINQYQFERCAYQNIDGWQPDATYQPEAFRFTGQQRPTVLQVYEADGIFRGGDDFIGQQLVTPLDANEDRISVTFTGADARYTLTYRVILEDAPTA